MSLFSRGINSSSASRLTLAQQEERLAYRLLAVPVTVVVLLVILPLLWNIFLSFQELRLIELQKLSLWTAEFTTRNYQKVVGARGFIRLLRTTLIYSLFGTILPLLLGLTAAVLARDAFPGRGVFRSILLFPYIAPIVATVFVWRMMFNAQFGIVNEWASMLGYPRLSYFSQRYVDLHLFGTTLKWPLALSMVIVFSGWRYFPFSFLFYLARLQALPEDLYEAAKVDGATLTQRFWYITLPQLRVVTATLVLLRFIWTFNKFDDVFLLTGGAAGTEVITVKIYDWLFGRADVGAAAALSIVLAIILAALLFIYFRYLFVEEEV